MVSQPVSSNWNDTQINTTLTQNTLNNAPKPHDTVLTSKGDTQHTNTQNSNTAKKEPTHRNIGTRTTSAKHIHWGREMKHTHTNTEFIHKKDKSTNTDPLITLDPSDVTNLNSGLHIVTYNPQSIFMCTNNTSSIRPLGTSIMSQKTIKKH